MARLLVAWLSTTPPHFAARLYWSAVTRMYQSIVGKNTINPSNLVGAQFLQV